jgi:predicted AlkP superfamily phosphohydrolase/phosphomutase
MERAALDRRRFLRLLAGSAAAAGASAGISGCRRRSSRAPKVVVLGLDGLDPTLIKRLIDAGRAPAFAKLAELGTFTPLATTMPALSPVAWSSFITGLTPGGHGIGDFIMRDPATYLPVFSIYEQLPPGRSLRLAGCEMPLTGGGMRNLRHGKPFWAYLTEQGIPASVFRIPTNFPIEETATRALSGMGAPDLVDTYGIFNYYTSNELEDYPGISGGNVTYVDVVDYRVRTELPGPLDSFCPPSPTTVRRDPTAVNSKVPFAVYLDADSDTVLIEIQGRRVVLKCGELSAWVPVEFELLPLVGKVRGICRFLLQEVRPHFRLYVTPINIDPEAQAVQVTYPEELGGELARAIGPFWTKGLPCDTKAFDYGILSDEEYAVQAQAILQEQLAQFDYEWGRFDEGLFYFYVSNTDQDSHMLWRNMDPTHPMHAASDPRLAGYLEQLYEQMDKLVAKVLPAIDDDTLVLVCSDHGFVQFGRQVHVNSFLRERGFLAIKDEAKSKEATTILDVDWAKTVAYGIGFNGLYLNLKGRERDGIVDPAQAQATIAKLKRELEELRDPDTGARPVDRVYLRDQIYTGAHTNQMAELFVGFTPGYRSSSSSVLGETGRAIIDINPWAWSGDHSMSRDLVPGVLFSSRRVAKANPSLLDLPVTILEHFGIAKPADMVGSSLFDAG